MDSVASNKTLAQRLHILHSQTSAKGNEIDR